MYLPAPYPFTFDRLPLVDSVGSVGTETPFFDDSAVGGVRVEAFG